ncbi:hypothetical protein HDU86_000801 [Geranomyces michiganensis]|nr:hypothetical protein HDU86_000801 [Geranomyces michiganensis]
MDMPSDPSSGQKRTFQPPRIPPEQMVLDYIASHTAAMEAGAPYVEGSWLPPDIAQASFASTPTSSAQINANNNQFAAETQVPLASVPNSGFDHSVAFDPQYPDFNEKALGLDFLMNPPNPTTQPLVFDPALAFDDSMVGRHLAPNVIGAPMYVGELATSPENLPPFRSRAFTARPTFKPIKPLPKRKLKAVGAGSVPRRPIPAPSSALSSSAPTGSVATSFAAAFQNSASTKAATELPASPNTNRKRGLPGSGPSDSDGQEPGPPLSFALVNGNGPSQSSIFQFEAYLASRAGQPQSQASAVAAAGSHGAAFRPSSAPPVSGRLPHKFVWTDPTVPAPEPIPKMEFGGSSPASNAHPNGASGAEKSPGLQPGPPPPSPTGFAGSGAAWQFTQTSSNPTGTSPRFNLNGAHQAFIPPTANGSITINPSTPGGIANPRVAIHSPQVTISPSAAAELRELERDQDEIDYFNVQHLTDLPPLVDDEELSRMFAADAAARERLAEASTFANTTATGATAILAGAGVPPAGSGLATPKSKKKKKKKGAADISHPTSPRTLGQYSHGAGAGGINSSTGGTAASAGAAGAAAPPPPRAPASSSPFLSTDTGTIFDKFRKPIFNHRARTARYEKEAKLGQHAAAAADWHCWFCEYEQAYGGRLWRAGGARGRRKKVVPEVAVAVGAGKVEDGTMTVPPVPPSEKQAGDELPTLQATGTAASASAAGRNQAPSPARTQQQQPSHARPLDVKTSA